ncbi:MAG: YlxR family protein [Deltaproteobacteria bacterium]|nr:YlxR family protein [Deltaproteobacteria bacterium]
MSKSMSKPIRTCIGCGAQKAKRELIRLTVDQDDRVIWDIRQVRTGRGAYLCPKADCLTAALKRGKFNRTFRRPVSTAQLATIEWTTVCEAKSKQPDQRASS